MIVTNKNLPMLREKDGAFKGYAYLAITTTKELYIVKQVGERSWDAMSINLYSETPVIHSNRKDIIEEVRKELDIDYIVECGSDMILRKAMMGHLFGGDMYKDFEIERIAND